MSEPPDTPQGRPYGFYRPNCFDSFRPLTPRQELFAQAVARGLTHRAALAEAGYNMRTYQRLARYPAVKARIERLLAEAAARSVITTDEISRQLQEIIARSKAGDSAPMLQTTRAAVMDLAKVHGLLDGKGGPTVKICDCGGANRVTEIRRVLVRPDGSEHALPTIPRWPAQRDRPPGDEALTDAPASSTGRVAPGD